MGLYACLSIKLSVVAFTVVLQIPIMCTYMYIMGKQLSMYMYDVCVFVCTSSGDLEAKIRNVFNIPDWVVCRLWQQYMTNSYELLPTPTQTIGDVGIYSGQVGVWSGVQ